MRKDQVLTTVHVPDLHDQLCNVVLLEPCPLAQRADQFDLDARQFQHIHEG